MGSYVDHNTHYSNPFTIQASRDDKQSVKNVKISIFNSEMPDNLLDMWLRNLQTMTEAEGGATYR